jgi:hypothetical protein
MKLQQQQIDEMPFRCHSVGDLMGVKGLGDTGKKRAMKTFIEMTTGRTHEIKSKYLDKGNLNEQEAINMVNRVLSENLIKNTERFWNDNLTGECDSKNFSKISDIKNSWDIFTFYESKVNFEPKYEWQGRGYMEGYNIDEFWLIFCLTDAPYTLVEKELKYMMDDDGNIRDVEKAYQKITNMVYTKESFYHILESQFVFNRDSNLEKSFIEIPESERVFVHKFTRDETKTKLMYSRIKEAKNYLKTIL